MIQVRITINGRPHELAIQERETLLSILRRRVGLTGAKRSCDLQVCGACTVLVDGAPVSSCTYLAYEANGKSVLTIEGLSDGQHLHPLQQAFIDHAGFQCGFCTSGMILSALALLQAEPRPTRERIVQWMRGNICRCTGYTPIIDAIEDAAQRLAAAGAGGGAGQ